MKYYLHRINNHPEWSRPLLENKNLLSIGWAHFASQPGFLSKHQDDWSKVPEAVEDEWGKVRPRFGLQRFLEMERGDRVVVPTWGAFHVYEVSDDARLVPAQIEDELADLGIEQGKKAVVRNGRIHEDHENGTSIDVDLGFFRRVTPLARGIRRDGYADSALTSRMKVRQTNVEVTNLRDSIENAMERHKAKRPINLRQIIKDKCASEVRNAILRFHNPDGFEQLIRRYFERQGASAEIPPKNEREKEGDADIIATFESLRLIVYVQAKHHHGQTDGWAVEQIQLYTENHRNTGADDEYTKISWVVSSAEKFTQDCINQARRAGVRLINGVEFAEMLIDSGVERL